MYGSILALRILSVYFEEDETQDFYREAIVWRRVYEFCKFLLSVMTLACLFVSIGVLFYSKAAL